MALIKCAECGKDFSDKAAACPNCGAPTEEIIKANLAIFNKVLQSWPKMSIDEFNKFIDDEWIKAKNFRNMLKTNENELTERMKSLEIECAEKLGIINNEFQLREERLKSINEELLQLNEDIEKLGFFQGAKKKTIKSKIEKLRIEENDNNNYIEQHDQIINGHKSALQQATLELEKTYSEDSAAKSCILKWFDDDEIKEAYYLEDKNDFAYVLRQKYLVFTAINPFMRQGRYFSGNEFSISIADLAKISGFDIESIQYACDVLANGPTTISWHYNIENDVLYNNSEPIYKPQEEIELENARKKKHDEAMRYILSSSSISSDLPRSKEKDASVIGRAVAGAVIAGPAGAVVGALSAVDKNNKNKK